MSLSINFEAHSRYMGHVIKHYGKLSADNTGNVRGYVWESFTDDGNTYQIIEHEADTLADLKRQVKQYEQDQRERIARLHAQN